MVVDLVGPIFPPTERGNKYILTMTDYATRYPEAFPSKDIQAETVAEALVNMFTRVGVPKEILIDQGSQFLSAVMKEMCRLLSLKQLVTTPYHPICNGLIVMVCVAHERENCSECVRTAKKCQWHVEEYVEAHVC